MKKFVFAAVVLMLLLVCCSVALAAGPACAQCGGPTTKAGGNSAWCHWYCASCDYTTSRNHNPNSNMSGLVPDSCSGRCRWCGAAANYSSHTFTNWVYNGDATCLLDGTETAKCDNVQCSATNTRTAVGTALGHTYSVKIIPPTCEGVGYAINTCIRCGDTYENQVVRPLGHLYTQWTYNGDGTHTAHCQRNRCNKVCTEGCTETVITVGGQTITYCPVCGHIVSTQGDAVLETDPDATVMPDYTTTLPDGTLMLIIDPAPLQIDVGADALYLFIASFQKDGALVDFTGKFSITVDLNKHPFEMAEGKFAGVLPAALKAEEVKVVRVDSEMVGEKPAEIWHELIFSIKDGVLTFETDKPGFFLMVPAETEFPSVG